MSQRTEADHRELDELFERYRLAPKSHVFAPLADACRKAGMIEEALEICARGVKAQPRYASGFVVQGKCLYDAGRAADAEATFRRVLEFDANNLVALKYLGIIHAERGDGARARHYFDHILALDPENREIRGRIDDGPAPAPDAREREATVSPAPPRPDEVATELPEVEDEDFEGEPITLRDEAVTSDEIATMTLADIYASQGYTSKALKIYREVLRRQPGDALLRQRIESLESLSARPEPVPAESADWPAAPAPVEERPADPRHAAAEPRDAAAPRRPSTPAPSPPAPVAGPPIDESRSYEQFKRWLKAMSG
jgi:tetratricopeptide (TPR) repeat protein